MAADLAALPPAFIVPDWPVGSAVRAFVTTRAGGVSTGDYASLNLGHGGPSAPGDDPALVEQNRARVAQHLPARPAWLRQVHGIEVLAADGPTAPGGAPVADAAVTHTPGVPLVVLVADCLPVLLADAAGSVLGVAHAGWRGLAAGVLERTVAAMRVAPGRIVAWLGPCIGPRAFAVGDDVRDAFVARDAGAAAAFVPHAGRKWLADLPALAQRRLLAAGVASVHGGGHCTVSDPARFFSYRRDGATGRMGAFAWLDAVADGGR